MTVEFASGPAEVKGKALGDLLHGWAITVHRAQGSEFPAVVVVLPPEAGGMLSRPLVYTALTRAQRHLSVVHAAGPALARAVRLGRRAAPPHPAGAAAAASTARRSDAPPRSMTGWSHTLAAPGPTARGSADATSDLGQPAAPRAATRCSTPRWPSSAGTATPAAA